MECSVSHEEYTKTKGVNSCGVGANVLDCNISGSEFELQSH